jgi:hypothetical protein
VVGLIALTGATGLTATAAAQEVTLVGVTFTPSKLDVATGFATATLDLALQSDQPIADSFGSCEIDTGSVYGTAVAGSRPWVAAGEQPVGWIEWAGSLTRVSGSPTDGVWRTTAPSEFSPAFTGSWTVSSFVNPFDCSGHIRVGPSGAFAVGSAERPPWKVMQAPLRPVKVVTGKELWTPRVRVTDRLTGAGIPAFITYPCSTCVFYQVARAHFSVRHPPPRADSSGYWSHQPQMVSNDPFEAAGIVQAWGNRGTGGYSLEAEGCVRPWVKWQANERVTTSGRTITITGNAWPAPSSFFSPTPFIRFQVLTNGRWTTVTSAALRSTGRYTLNWTAPTASTFQVRAYKPGSAGCYSSVGTVLPAVDVVVR